MQQWNFGVGLLGSLDNFHIIWTTMWFWGVFLGFTIFFGAEFLCYGKFFSKTKKQKTKKWCFQGVFCNVGWFSNLDPVRPNYQLDSHNGWVLKMRTNWHNYIWQLDSKLTSNSHMNENQSWTLVPLYII